MKNVRKVLPIAALIMLGTTQISVRAQNSNQLGSGNQAPSKVPGAIASQSSSNGGSASKQSTSLPPTSLSQSGNQSSEDAAPARDLKVLKLLKSSDPFMQQRDFRRALPILQEAAAVGPNLNEAVVHNLMGLCYENFNDIDRAFYEYKRAMEIKPGFEVPQHNLAIMYAKKADALAGSGKLDEIEKFRRESVRLNPKQPTFHNNLGSILQSKGDLEGAIGEYQQALSLEPQMEVATINLAKCYVNIGNFDQGRIYFQKFIADHPNSPWLKEAQDKLEYLKHKNVLPQNDNGPDYFRSAVQREAIKWPPEMMPIRVFIDPGTGVPGYRPVFQESLYRAFDDWSKATRGKVTWVRVPQPEQANIICTWAKDNSRFQNVSKEPTEEGEVSQYMTFVRDGQRYIQHVNVAITTFNAVNGKNLSDGETRNVALHECGHALGITGHSPDFHDIMFFITNPGGGYTERNISNRDSATMNLLYPDLQRR